MLHLAMLDAELLDSLGLPAGPDAAVLPEAYFIIARRISAAQARSVGFLPASAKVGVPPIVTRLGLALKQVTGAPVAFVDANVRWPAIEGKIDAAPSEESSAFVTKWLDDSFALLLPKQTGEAGAGVPELRRLLEDGSDLFAHLLVDLTGFRRFGEHLAAARLVDALVVVAQAHVNTNEELLQLREELQESRFLGVLLVGG